MSERLTADISADLRATGDQLAIEAADKLDGLLACLVEAEKARDAARAELDRRMDEDIAIASTNPLGSLWAKAVDAVSSRDFRVDPGECESCGEPTGELDEPRYLHYQRRAIEAAQAAVASQLTEALQQRDRERKRADYLVQQLAAEHREREGWQRAYDRATRAQRDELAAIPGQAALTLETVDALPDGSWRMSEAGLREEWLETCPGSGAWICGEPDPEDRVMGICGADVPCGSHEKGSNE